MHPSIQIQWGERPLVACFHAAEASYFGRPFVDPTVAEALAEPVSRLRESVEFDRVNPQMFFEHLIPLAAGMGVYELSRVLLTKLQVGLIEPILSRVRDQLNAIHEAYRSVAPAPSPEHVEATARLRQDWDLQKAGLLTAVVRWTDPRIVPEEVSVVVLPPLLGGGGAGHIRYKLVRIEVGNFDPAPPVPELLRLTWMLATLNLGLPMYSESLRPNRLALVGPLATIPLALSAGEHMHLTTCDAATMAVAANAWLGAGDQVERLVQWWQTYQAIRPSWGKALQGLDLLLD